MVDYVILLVLGFVPYYIGWKSISVPSIQRTFEVRAFFLTIHVTIQGKSQTEWTIRSLAIKRLQILLQDILLNLSKDDYSQDKDLS